MDLTGKYEISSEQICWHCNTSEFRFDCTDQLIPLQGFVGQDKALKAIQFGLEVEKPGYNLFVTGLTGTGKASAIKTYLQAIVDERKQQGVQFPIRDWCYVHNFDDPDRPRIIEVPPGQGRHFQSGVDQLLKTLKEEIPKVFASDEHTSERRQVEEGGRAVYQSRVQELEADVRAENFGFQFSQAGVNLYPLTAEGTPIPPEGFANLNDEERSSLDEKRGRLSQRVQETMEGLKAVEKETQDKLYALNRSVGEIKLTDLFYPLMEDSRDLPDITSYLASLKAYALNHLDLFTVDGEQPAGPVAQVPQSQATIQGNPLLTFEINVLVDNSHTQAAPIIIESNPTWGNLFGRIERRAFMGAYFSDHTMLRPGSIHHANGGYLVINVQDLMANPGVWEGLKRAIRDKEARLEDPAVQSGIMPPQGLRPQPMSWDAKVIVTGDENLYRMLSTYDREDFWEMFKVKAEFDSQIDLTPDNVQDYCAFICGTCTSEDLLHADRSGVARVVEYGARLVNDQTKLSTRFGLIKDLLIEADYWTGKGGSPLITSMHVKKALDEKTFRLNLVEEKLRSMISEGTLMVDVEGEVTGQVNGLVVYDMGDFSFGRPARITAKTYTGRQGVVDIQREAQLSGRTHDKGVLILSGHLGSKFAQEVPLSLSASLSFEQSYEGVDGDSASSTELYAILSSLADLPIRQEIAVTGSVNQKGEIQPIGGVNQKVEGFYDVCRTTGLTGQQGVMVPHQNVKNLMLRDDVVESVTSGEFHIYSVKTVDEGIEVLTGVPAGERGANGKSLEGTVNYLVDKRLKELAGSLKGFYAEVLGDATG